MTFKIDDDVPMPERPTPGRQAKYPFAQMKPGQSVFVAGTNSSRFSGTVQAAQKRLGFKFATRTVIENGVSGLRVWRVE